MRKLRPFVLFGLMLAGCVRLDNHGFLDSRLVDDIKSGKMVEIAKYTPFAWDRLYIYEPRSLRETIKQETGVSVPYPHLDGGGYCLLVFTQQGTIAAAFEEPRGVVDFMNLYQHGGYAAASAVFTGSIMPDGSVLLRRN